MALTKVTGSVIKDSVSLSGNVSVGGTLTYQDVTNVDALGIGTFRAGIDISGGDLTIPDKIIHTGDTNTAIRFPAADTITAETGGTERLRIDSSGRLLLGTTTEGHADADDFTIGTSTNSAGITIRTNTSGTGRLWFSDGTSGDSEYQGYIQYDHNNQILALGSGGSTRLRITSGGDILLNKGNNQNTLMSNTSDGSDNQSIFVGGGGGPSDTRGAYIWAKGNEYTTTGGFLQLNAGNVGTAPITFSTGGNERLRITSAGRVGINETSPDGELHIKGTNPYIYIEGTNGSGRQHKIWSAGGNSQALQLTSGELYYNADTQVFRASNESTEYARINSSGQLIMTNAATQTFFDFSTTNNTTRGLFSVAGKDGSGNAVTVKIGGFGDTNRGEIFTHSNHSLGFATNNAAAQVILHTSGLFDVVGECRATNFYLRGNGSPPTADASIFRPADNTLAFATGSTERIRIENSGISGTIKNNYALVAFVSDRDDGSRNSGSTSYQDDTGLNISNAITYRHGDIFFVEALCPTGIALVSTDTANYQGVNVRIKLTPSSGTTRYSSDTKGWYRDDGRATKETMPMTVTHYHLQGSDTSSFSDNVQISFQVQYRREPGGAGSYGATGLSTWGGERSLKVWQFRKAL